MRKSIVFVTAFVLLSFAASQVCFAQLINYNRRQGVQPPPARPAPAPAAREQAIPSVMDDNAVLKDALAAVNKNGSYKVDSDILKKYDLNNNGVINRAEAKAIEADIRYY